MSLCVQLTLCEVICCFSQGLVVLFVGKTCSPVLGQTKHVRRSSFCCGAMEPSQPDGPAAGGRGNPGEVPDSGVANFFRSCFPRGNLVLNIMHAAATPVEAEQDERPLPMVAMGGRVQQGDMGRRNARGEGDPYDMVTSEASYFRGNVSYHGKFGQNGLDHRGVDRKHGGNPPSKGASKKAEEPNWGSSGKRTNELRIKAVAKGARAKAHGRSHLKANERGGIPVEEVLDLSDVEEEENDVKVKGVGKGANMKRAIELAKDPKKLRKAKTNFKTRFLAFNTMQSRNSKRRKVLEVMQSITGMDDPFPVDQELLVGVGTAMDEAKLQAGDQYVHEVKLMHLEAGYEWSMSMERQLYLVKNALKRHKGPEVRATEVKIEELNVEVWEKVVTHGVSHRRPAWAYAFACIWMLRAAEVVKVKAKHLEVKFEPKEVCLYIPSSKTDQRGKGTTRTLRCICNEEQGCSRWCAWANAVRCLAEHAVPNPEAKLFKPAKKNSQPGKAQMVKMWAKHVAETISGHSARRSGASYYTRCGMDVAGVMFLGRWKSSAVLRYIEDALQSMPANRKLLEKMAEKDPFLKEDLEIRTKGDMTGRAQVPNTTAQERQITKVEIKELLNDMKEQCEPDELAKITEVEQLWAVSTSRSNRTAHVVVKAAWGLNLDSWSTACGWHFAEKFVKVKLMKECPEGVRVCTKCSHSNMVRDKVSGGQSLAQMMAGSWKM